MCDSVAVRKCLVDRALRCCIIKTSPLRLVAFFSNVRAIVICTTTHAHAWLLFAVLTLLCTNKQTQPDSSNSPVERNDPTQS